MSHAGPLSNPFPGLRPFHADEEHLFFGRDDQVDAMIDKLAMTRLLAVVGTSGSGKSSLVNCGLIPGLVRGQMARAGSAWRVALMRPGVRPVRALAEALSQPGLLGTGAAPVAGFAPADLMEATLGLSKRGLLDAFEQAHLEPQQNLLLVVDQFEELFRYQGLGQQDTADTAGAVAARGEAASAFVKLLLEAVAQQALPIWVVLTMRSDFLGECAQFFGLPEAVNRGQYLVPRMTLDERRDAIAEPLRLHATAIDDALLTRLVNDVGDNADQLSILQHALNRTWAVWQRGGASGPLTLAHYQDAGSMAHALDQHAEEALRTLPPGRLQAVAQALFRAITDRVTDARGTRRPTRLDQLQAISGASAAELARVIEVFRDPERCFLMPPAGVALTPDTPIDISHETLMRVWDRLLAWGNAEAQSAQTYRRLGETAALYSDKLFGLLRQPELQFYAGWQAREQPNPAWAARYRAGFADTMAYLQRSRQAERQRWWRGRALVAVLVAVPTLFSIGMLQLYRQTQAARLVADDARDDAQKAQQTTIGALAAADAGRNAAQQAERKTADALGQAQTSRNRAEELLAFLIGENFLQKLRPVGRTDILDAVQDEVQRYLDQTQPQTPGPQQASALRATGLAQRNAGDLLLAKGKTQLALLQFRAAADTFARLAAQAPGDTAAGRLQAQAEQARALYQLGDVQSDQGQASAALASHGQALGLRRVVAAGASPAPAAADASVELSLSHSAVGRMLNNLGRPRDALHAVDAALKRLPPLPAQAAPAQWLKARIDALESRANALDLLDDAPQREQARKAIADLVERWRTAQPLSAEARQREVAMAVQRTDLPPDDLPAHYQLIDASMNDLVRWDGANQLWRRDQQVIRIMRADSLRNIGQTTPAQALLDQVQPELVALAANDPGDLQRQRDLAWLHQQRGLLAMRQARHTDALRALADAEQRYARLVLAAPEDVHLRRDWYWSVYQLAAAQRDAGHPAQALAGMQKGRDIVTGLQRRAPQMASLAGNLVLYFDTAEMELLKSADDGPRTDALLGQMQALLARAMAVARPPSPGLLAAAAQGDRLRARRAEATGRSQDALALRHSSLVLAERVTRLSPDDAPGWTALADAAAALATQQAKTAPQQALVPIYQAEVRAREKALALKPDAPQQASDGQLLTVGGRSLATPARAANPPAEGASAPAQASGLGSQTNQLHVALVHLGDAQDKSGDSAAALAAFTRSLAPIQQATTMNAHEPVYASNLANAWWRIAKLRAKTDLAGALAAYNEAEAPSQTAFALETAPALRASRANLAHLRLVEQGDLLAGRRRHHEALGSFQAALRWLDKATAQAPTVALYARNLAVLQRRLATQQQALQQPGDAAAALLDSTRSAELAASLVSAQDSPAERAGAELERLRAHTALAQWQAEHNAPGLALESRRQALAAAERMARLAPASAEQEDALAKLQRLIAAQASSPEVVEAAWRSAVAAGQRAIALGPTSIRLDLVAHDLYDLGNHLKAQGALLPAAQAYQQAAAQLQRAMDLADQPGMHWIGLSLCQRLVGETLAQLPGRRDDAAVAFAAAVSAGQSATKTQPRDAAAWHTLALARQGQALQHDRAGQPAQGQAGLDLALQDAHTAARLDSTDDGIQHTISTLRKAIAAGR